MGEVEALRVEGTTGGWTRSFLVSATVNTDADRFDDKGLRGWREESRVGHSRKPDAFYSLVEAASAAALIWSFFAQGTATSIDIHGATKSRAGWPR